MTRSKTNAATACQPQLERRNRLVEAHRQLVAPLACHYARLSPEGREDLSQVGLLGLIRAAELYRPEQGTPFEAFARPHIRGAILHYLRDVAPCVRLPRRQAELQERLCRQERSAAPGKPACVPGVSEETRALLLRQRQLCRAVPLEGALLETVCAEPQEAEPPSPASPGRARQLLACLEPRQRRVVAQVVLAGWSYRRLAGEMGISPMTVKRLLHQGLDQLRDQLERQGVSRSEWADPSPSAARAC